MSCRRICRELLWQARFGELGPGAAPHLDHLTECRACRDELGFDRALVRQLRTALAERVAGAAPSPNAWQGVLARMAAPEPRPSRIRAWSTALVARLRFGSAMAGATLAVVMALNLEIVAVRPSDASALPAAGASAPSRPLSLADGFSQAAASAPYAILGDRADDDAPFTVSARGVWAQEPEHLPIRGARTGGADEPASDPNATGEEPGAAAPSRTDAWQPLTVRLVPGDAAVVRGAASEEPDEPDDVADPPAPSAPPEEGTPS